MTDIKSKPSKRLERLLALAALVTIVIAYFIGLSRAEADLEPFFEQAFPVPNISNRHKEEYTGLGTIPKKKIYWAMRALEPLTVMVAN